MYWSVMKMTNKRTAVFSLLLLLLLATLASCSSEHAADDVVPGPTTLIYEETMSPNEAYVSSKEELVTLEIQIYQSKDDTILVDARSNSPLIKDQQYSVPFDRQISKENIRVTWTTMMGSPEPAEEDQLMVADIAILLDGEVVSEQKVNFGTNAMEIVTEAIDQAQ